jgi:subtilisin family serine protease
MSGSPQQPATAQTTGRSVVVFSDDVHLDRVAMTAALRSLAEVATVVATSDADDGALDGDALASADVITFDALGVAVVAREPGELAASLAATGAGAGIVSVEPEHVLHAIVVEQPAARAEFSDDDAFTWGLRATGVDASSATGQGIRIAVLDTGLDFAHPDFAGRAITSRSFVTGLPVDDGHGHGTHCAGTAAGPARPGQGRRYGIASQATLFVGRVLDDSGAGADAGILAGIDWAITNGCRIISLSLGGDVRTVSTAYETVGRRALAAGALIVAAAGNNADRRRGDPGFVGIPANSPSIMAVAAVDSDLRIAEFSAAGNPVAGGAVDLAAPGVAVYSAWPMPRRTNTISGTSQATPHVAGIAALWSQVTGDTANALWATVVGAARRLDLPAADAGAGLVQAPGSASL